jgi:epoxyqueuosine reductase
VLDARRCISYLTIEHRGDIDPALHEDMGTWRFGCDVCQDVCPWNRKAPVTSESAFQPRDHCPAPEEMAAMDDEALRRRFAGTALLRAKPTGLRRNAVIALANARRKASVTAPTSDHSGGGTR